jgi:eukaryotic-like serine/threonine-protein kinase
MAAEADPGPDFDWAPPQEFDDYEIVKPLGSGQNGRVFLALDTVLDRHVAVKFLSDSRPGLAARQRLLLEARAAARIHHPNVVAIYRVGEHDDRPYLVSEFVRGTTLARLERPVAWQRALAIGVDLARGLAAAHRRGVLHRDLNPGNAIVDEEGAVKLLDFGLASFGGGPGTGATGTVTGTPDYLAPELWRGEPASRRSDVYALGALLYHLIAGKTPHADVAAEDLPRAAVERDAPALEGDAPSSRALAAVLARCLARDPDERFASADELRAALEDIALEAERGAAAAAPDANPYRGLRPFEAEHRAFFFGRTYEAGLVLERLTGEPFVLVAGDSGVGKSSLCRAAVLPAVLEGRLGEGRTWRVATFIPGRRPLPALAAALAPIVVGGEEAVIALAEEPAALAQAVSRALGAEGGLVLFVDQIEELVTLAPPDEREVCARLLHYLASGVRGIRVLASARADFLTRVAALPGLGQEVGRALFLLGGLSPENVREAVTGPARVLGVGFESDAVVDALVQGAAGSGGLPLLQFALAELWEARDRESATITAASLEAVGGVGGSLARHADEVIAQLLPPERRAAHRLLLRMVTAEGTRALRTGADLGADDPATRGALDGLVRGRILVVHEVDGADAYELAHEILAREWATLARWIEEAKGSRRIQERVSNAAAEWQRLDRSRDQLWTRAQLAEADRVPDELLRELERAFLVESRRRVVRQIWRRRAAIAAVPLLIGAGYAGFRIQESRRVARVVSAEMTRGREHLEVARIAAARAAGLRGEAFAMFDRGDPGAEERYDAALEATESAHGAFLAAEARMEAALAHDATRADVRSLHADILLDRALLAEAGWRLDLRDELARRMEFYDPDGAHRRRLAAPAQLSVEVDPPGADIRLHVFERKGDRFVLSERPVARRGDLAPGSYLLLVTARGRAPVRYPVRLERGERRQVRIALPPADRVPRGFVFIPPGRYLSGSAGDDDLRRAFFNAPPLHAIETGGYLIAEREVTFADWIEFLEAQDPAESARRTPGVSTLGTRNVKLERDDEDWTLSLPLGDQVVSAREGRPIVYPGRQRRREQDWLAMPVLGISAEDAEAYATWLRATGRVPGARLCTEREWVRAARGADERTFPHGFRLEPDDACFDATYKKDPGSMGPDEVGSHPTTRSPFGLDDMVGNAFEWTHAQSPGVYAIRGGSYFDARITLQVPNRLETLATVRDPTLGLRVCADAPAVE